MGAPTIVEYQGEKMRATKLAKRVGLSPSCIVERWRLGLREEELASPTPRRRRKGPTEQQKDLADKQQTAPVDPNAHSREVRRRAREKAARLALELVAEYRRPLIDANLLTDDERIENQQKVKGRQRWNGGWFGESHESRESGR